MRGIGARLVNWPAIKAGRFHRPGYCGLRNEQMPCARSSP